MGNHPDPPTPGDTSEPTRDALIRAAEQLMAEHGIEGAELREINRLAGQRNTSAVHYHFADRQGLIVAIRDKHRPAIDAERQRRLDALASTPALDLHDLTRALVEPMSTPLATASGRDFLIIVAEAAGRVGSRALLASDLPYTDGLTRLNHLLLQHVAGPRPRREALVSHAVLTAATLLADLARDINAGRATLADRDTCVQTIVEYIASGLASIPRPAERDT